MFNIKSIFVILLALALTLASHAAIEPSQVLIVGNSRNNDSMRLAKIYAKARHIPDQNILMLDIPDHEEISRQQYKLYVADPIRQFLQQLKLENKIKVIVTVYGMPIRIGAANPDLRQQVVAKQIRDKFSESFTELETAYRNLEKKAGVTTTQPTTLPGRERMEHFLPQLQQIATKVQGLYRRWVTQLQSVPAGESQQQAVNEFIGMRLRIEGQVAMVASLQNQPGQAEALKQVRQLESEFAALMRKPPETRDLGETTRKARELGGLFLELRALYEDYCRATQRDSLSALDSELSLVLWNDYAIAGRLPNALNPRFASNPVVAGQPPVMMVSRLDGPTPAVVERIIRDSLTVENTGLKGKIYLDARGITSQGGYFEYDQNVRDLAATLKSKTSLPVVLDDKSELFKPGSCPDTALYCGWYSLKNYIPAFTFNRGAVAFHIASFEAMSLKNKTNNEWVKRLLENGVCATLGPVAEPYLDSFPMPSEFFGLLLTGKYTLAEVYYRTVRYTSWRQMLIGDPLYNPFAKNPAMKEDDVKMGPLNYLFVE